MIVKTKIMRPAVAMIELIFAIVIMAIVLLSAPMLISTASKSGFIAIQQEAINEAASQVNIIMGHHWDEGAANDLYLDPILQVSASGDAELVENGTKVVRQTISGMNRIGQKIHQTSACVKRLDENLQEAGEIVILKIIVL